MRNAETVPRTSKPTGDVICRTGCYIRGMPDRLISLRRASGVAPPLLSLLIVGLMSLLLLNSTRLYVIAFSGTIYPLTPPVPLSDLSISSTCRLARNPCCRGAGYGRADWNLRKRGWDLYLKERERRNKAATTDERQPATKSGMNYRVNFGTLSWLPFDELSNRGISVLTLLLKPHAAPPNSKSLVPQLNIMGREDAG